MSEPIETAPTDREILAYNDMYGWYRTRRVEHAGHVVYPLYGLLGREGGVWFPVPSHWDELPPIPAGRQCWHSRTTSEAERDIDQSRAEKEARDDKSPAPAATGQDGEK